MLLPVLSSHHFWPRTLFRPFDFPALFLGRKEPNLNHKYLVEFGEWSSCFVGICSLYFFLLHFFGVLFFVFFLSFLYFVPVWSFFFSLTVKINQVLWTFDNSKKKRNKLVQKKTKKMCYILVRPSPLFLVQEYNLLFSCFSFSCQQTSFYSRCDTKTTGTVVGE